MHGLRSFTLAVSSPGTPVRSLRRGLNRHLFQQVHKLKAVLTEQDEAIGSAVYAVTDRLSKLHDNMAKAQLHKMVEEMLSTATKRHQRTGGGSWKISTLISKDGMTAVNSCIMTTGRPYKR